MRTIVFAAAAAALLAAAPLPADTASAQVDVRIGPPRAGVVVETEGRRYHRQRDRDDCKKITITEWRNGVKVKRTKWRCD